MTSSSSTTGLHAALVIVPSTLLVGALGMAALVFDGFFRGDMGGVGAAAFLGAGGVAVLVVAVSALAMFLWIGQWWTEEADTPLAPQPAPGDESPRARAGENARSRQISKARALDRWLNEGGGDRRGSE